MKTNNHILLTNGQIIDVEKGVISRGSIEIRDGMIQKVFLDNDDIPHHIKKIDLKKKYIIPGLIDMHCHIREEFAHHFVAAGVTTVRNTAGDLRTLQPLIDAPLDAPTPEVYSADWLIDGEPVFGVPLEKVIMLQMTLMQLDKKFKDRLQPVPNSLKYTVSLKPK